MTTNISRRSALAAVAATATLPVGAVFGVKAARAIAPVNSAEPVLALIDQRERQLATAAVLNHRFKELRYALPDHLFKDVCVNLSPGYRPDGTIRPFFVYSEAKLRCYRDRLNAEPWKTKRPTTSSYRGSITPSAWPSCELKKRCATPIRNGRKPRPQGKPASLPMPPSMSWSSRSSSPR